MPGDGGKKFFGRIRPWQWIKHSVFTQYLWVWAMKVGSPPQAKTIWVIDAFAGAGEFRDEETGETAEGSPLRAALIAKKYNELPKKLAEGKQLRLICIERDPDNYVHLKERLSGFAFATVLPGEFGEHADTIVSMIGSDRALVLLDPIGVKSIDAATCKNLLHRPGKTDAFVNVQFAIVHRTRGQLLANGEPNPDIPGSAALVENMTGSSGPASGGRSRRTESRSRSRRTRICSSTSSRSSDPNSAAKTRIPSSALSAAKRSISSSISPTTPTQTG